MRQIVCDEVQLQLLTLFVEARCFPKEINYRKHEKTALPWTYTYRGTLYKIAVIPKCYMPYFCETPLN